MKHPSPSSVAILVSAARVYNVSLVESKRMPHTPEQYRERQEIVGRALAAFATAVRIVRDEIDGAP